MSLGKKAFCPLLSTGSTKKKGKCFDVTEIIVDLGRKASNTRRIFSRTFVIFSLFQNENSCTASTYSFYFGDSLQWGIQRGFRGFA